MNRHPVDALVEVREEIKALQAKEAALKDQILDALKEPLQPGETQSIAGDDYAASVSLVSSERLDRAAVERLLSRPKFASCLKSSTSITVRTTARVKAAA